MSKKEYKEFQYLLKEDYDSKIKINGEDLKVYSKDKLEDLYPNNDYLVIGETFEKKKRDKKKDIGRIEINEKVLYVVKDGDHNKIFKKQSAFVEEKGGNFIAILKLRILPIILIVALLLGGIGGLLIGLKNNDDPKIDDDIDPGITPVVNDILTIKGSVTNGLEGIEGVTISLRNNDVEVAHASTDKKGNYLISDVKNGLYNLVCIYNNSILTKSAIVKGNSIVVNFHFALLENSDVKAQVKMVNETTNITVGGLDEEVMLYALENKEVDLTLFAEHLDENNVPAIDKEAITRISGELEITYYDFSVLKEIFKNNILESSEYLKNTNNILEIAVPYDSSKALGTYVFRHHNENSIRFEELSEKPSNNFQDGTYYVTADIVYVYTNCFSTYAIGAAKVNHVVKGSDTITYSSKATINLKTGKIDMLYKHDLDSTNDARIELYLVGKNSNLLIAQSGIIPVGYEIKKMTLLSDIKNMPSVGTYNGFMRIIYIGTNGNTSTNVDIPLSVAITQ